MSKLISAVMVTGHQPQRRPFADRAVDAFLRQLYVSRELVILNASSRPIRPASRRVKNVPFSQDGLTLGEVRQAAFDHCQGEWVIFWDDDDHHHWARMALQAQAAGVNLPEPTADCCLLRNQLKYSFELDIALAYHWPEGNVVPGGPGTMLFWKTKADKPFRSVTKHEDTHFILDNFDPWRIAAVDNAPETYVRFYHGHNTHDGPHIMGPLHIAENRGSRLCTPEASKYLRSLLEGPYGALKTILGRR
jgi:hypothetical protein